MLDFLGLHTAPIVEVLPTELSYIEGTGKTMLARAMYHFAKKIKN